MRYKQDGQFRSGLSEVVNRLEQKLSTGYIHVNCWLVENHQLRLGYQRAGDEDFHLFAGRHRTQPLIEQLLAPQLTQQFRRAGFFVLGDVAINADCSVDAGDDHFQARSAEVGHPVVHNRADPGDLFAMLRQVD